MSWPMNKNLFLPLACPQEPGTGLWGPSILMIVCRPFQANFLFLHSRRMTYITSSWDDSITDKRMIIIPCRNTRLTSKTRWHRLLMIRRMWSVQVKVFLPCAVWASMKSATTDEYIVKRLYLTPNFLLHWSRFCRVVYHRVLMPELKHEQTVSSQMVCRIIKPCYLDYFNSIVHLLHQSP